MIALPRRTRPPSRGPVRHEAGVRVAEGARLRPRTRASTPLRLTENLRRR
ncbi:hypothetical protein HMPREF9056_01375 [Actinomyces sp. oral taxon 170 str. F0386]|nr:hypothetical protein HMPREF9056_01375 [Actinomyces sp. oral taxon 170 str. F0386]